VGDQQKCHLMAGHYLSRLLLAVVHFAFLCCAHFMSWLQEIHSIIRGRRRSAVLELQKLRIFPEHIALVLDDVSDAFCVPISETIQFILDIPQIFTISVFVGRGELPFSISSKKVRVFHGEDVTTAFQKVMESKAPLRSAPCPFETKLDLVIAYSRSSSLCGFFPWEMDLATFYLAGPVANISPASIVKGLGQYDRTEQRFGK
jgi:hypothetical protein